MFANAAEIVSNSMILGSIAVISLCSYIAFGFCKTCVGLQYIYLQLCLILPRCWNMFHPSGMRLYLQATRVSLNLCSTSHLLFLILTTSLSRCSALYIQRRNLELNLPVMKHVPIRDAGSPPRPRQGWRGLIPREGSVRSQEVIRGKPNARGQILVMPFVVQEWGKHAHMLFTHIVGTLLVSKLFLRFIS